MLSCRVTARTVETWTPGPPIDLDLFLCLASAKTDYNPRPAAASRSPTRQAAKQRRRSISAALPLNSLGLDRFKLVRSQKKSRCPDRARHTPRRVIFVLASESPAKKQEPNFRSLAGQGEALPAIEEGRRSRSFCSFRIQSTARGPGVLRHGCY